MAGGRNQPYQRQDDSDEEAEMSDSEVSSANLLMLMECISYGNSESLLKK